MSDCLSSIIAIIFPKAVTSRSGSSGKDILAAWITCCKAHAEKEKHSSSAKRSIDVDRQRGA